mgnify:CR=1 FL=1
MPSNWKPSLTTSLWVTVILSKLRDLNNSDTDYDLYLLNSNVYNLPVFPTTLAKDVDRDPLPVPASTTTNPGLILSLYKIAETSGVNNICVLLANVSVTRVGDGFNT